MKNRLLILLFVVISFEINAQNDSTAVINHGIGISLTPTFSMPKSAYNVSVKGLMSFTGGLNGIVVLSKKAGIYLSAELGYSSNAMSFTGINGLRTNNNGNVVFYNPNQFTFNDRYNNAYFALNLQAVIVKVAKKLFLIAGIGGQMNYCYSFASIEKSVSGTGQSASNVQVYYGSYVYYKYSASAIAKIGLMIKFSRHLSLSVSPVFYYGLNPTLLFKHNYMGYNDIGLNTQLTYHF